MHLFPLLILWLNLLGLVNPEPERNSFGVFWGDDEIGEIHADLTYSNKQIHYRVQSNSNFRIVWKYNQQFLVEMDFEDGVLHYGSSKDYLNQKLKKHAITSRHGNYYQRLEGTNPIDPLKEEIYFTTALLYFKEPLGIHKAYSEHYQVFAPLERLEDHRYKLELPGKRTNYYTYDKGLLQHVEVNRTWVTITFRRRS